MKRVHTIEGFERDVLPALKGYFLKRMGDRYGEYRAVCLKGAIRLAQVLYGESDSSGGFTLAQLDAMEVGFEGWDASAFSSPTEYIRRRKAAPAAYYHLGKAIYAKYGKK